ncbi:Protein of unknown function [Vibrio xiamenensis]|uniref:DUF3549 domain-containing protein n=1 Tax=Vibrio xiamenensis TaxID=861298 RepID=A0A1G8EC35_9VIBR|nr:DUF3549 family protein [Vibrio xiamenensis]SDH67476.1 Protein of unknown function [Vibrio xiamenensis]
METITTLSQLLTNSGCEFRIFDLGRRISPIEHKEFFDVEKGLLPYPYPLQRKAHVAIAYWNEQQQPWIWFLKFELDERGLLKQAEIGQFLKYVMEAMGSRLSQEISEEQQQKLANNPYTYKPSEDKMAVFHSQIRAALNLPTSQYYEHAQHYFQGGLGWDNWQTVGLQGITDMCARLSQDNNQVTLRKSLNHLPNEPLYALLGALEHTQTPEKLAARLLDMANQQLQSGDADLFLVSALVRALSGAPNALRSLVDDILASPTFSHQEVLIGIAGRAWQVLDDTGVATRFLVRLAETGNQTLFNQLFADLVMIPKLRMVLLPLLHSSPSPELAQALTALQRSAKGSA